MMKQVLCFRSLSQCPLKTIKMFLPQKSNLQKNLKQRPSLSSQALRALRVLVTILSPYLWQTLAFHPLSTNVLANICCRRFQGDRDSVYIHELYKDWGRVGLARCDLLILWDIFVKFENVRVVKLRVWGLHSVYIRTSDWIQNIRVKGKLINLYFHLWQKALNLKSQDMWNWPLYLLPFATGRLLPARQSSSTLRLLLSTARNEMIGWSRSKFETELEMFFFFVWTSRKSLWARGNAFDRSCLWVEPFSFLGTHTQKDLKVLCCLLSVRSR